MAGIGRPRRGIGGDSPALSASTYTSTDSSTSPAKGAARRLRWMGSTDSEDSHLSTDLVRPSLARSQGLWPTASSHAPDRRFSNTTYQQSAPWAKDPPAYRQRRSDREISTPLASKWRSPEELWPEPPRWDSAKSYAVPIAREDPVQSSADAPVQHDVSYTLKSNAKLAPNPTGKQSMERAVAGRRVDFQIDRERCGPVNDDYNLCAVASQPVGVQPGPTTTDYGRHSCSTGTLQQDRAESSRVREPNLASSICSVSLAFVPDALSEEEGILSDDSVIASPQTPICLTHGETIPPPPWNLQPSTSSDAIRDTCVQAGGDANLQQSCGRPANGQQANHQTFALETPALVHGAVRVATSFGDIAAQGPGTGGHGTGTPDTSAGLPRDPQSTHASDSHVAAGHGDTETTRNQITESVDKIQGPKLSVDLSKADDQCRALETTLAQTKNSEEMLKQALEQNVFYQSELSSALHRLDQEGREKAELVQALQLEKEFSFELCTRSTSLPPQGRPRQLETRGHEGSEFEELLLDHQRLSAEVLETDPIVTDLNTCGPRAELGEVIAEAAGEATASAEVTGLDDLEAAEQDAREAYVKRLEAQVECLSRELETTRNDQQHQWKSLVNAEANVTRLEQENETLRAKIKGFERLMQDFLAIDGPASMPGRSSAEPCMSKASSEPALRGAVQGLERPPAAPVVSIAQEAAPSGVRSSEHVHSDSSRAQCGANAQHANRTVATAVESPSPSPLSNSLQAAILECAAVNEARKEKEHAIASEKKNAAALRRASIEKAAADSRRKARIRAQRAERAASRTSSYDSRESSAQPSSPSRVENAATQVVTSGPLSSPKRRVRHGSGMSSVSSGGVSTTSVETCVRIDCSAAQTGEAAEIHGHGVAPPSSQSRLDKVLTPVLSSRPLSPPERRARQESGMINAGSGSMVATSAPATSVVCAGGRGAAQSSSPPRSEKASTQVLSSRPLSPPERRAQHGSGMINVSISGMAGSPAPAAAMMRSGSRESAQSLSPSRSEEMATQVLSSRPLSPPERRARQGSDVSSVSNVGVAAISAETCVRPGCSDAPVAALMCTVSRGSAQVLSNRPLSPPERRVRQSSGVSNGSNGGIAAASVETSVIASCPDAAAVVCTGGHGSAQSPVNSRSETVPQIVVSDSTSPPPEQRARHNSGLSSISSGSELAVPAEIYVRAGCSDDQATVAARAGSQCAAQERSRARMRYHQSDSCSPSRKKDAGIRECTTRAGDAAAGGMLDVAEASARSSSGRLGVETRPTDIASGCPPTTAPTPDAAQPTPVRAQPPESMAEVVEAAQGSLTKSRPFSSGPLGKARALAARS